MSKTTTPSKATKKKEREIAPVEIMDVEGHLPELAEKPNTGKGLKTPARKRSSVNPPLDLRADMSLFEYLAECNPSLEKKIAEIAVSQSGVPSDLHDEAVQEIYIMWHTTAPDTSKYKPGQIASYAHRMARHACLRIRRELGSSVRLPGSAFRKRSDGTSYVTPGVLAAPLDWAELESWFDTDDLVDLPTSNGSGLTSASAEEIMESMDEAATSPDHDEEEQRRQVRMEKLDKCTALTREQAAVMRMLIEEATYDEICDALSIKRGALMRHIAIATSVIGKV